MSKVEINSLLVIDSEELATIDEVDDASYPEVLEPKSDDTATEIRQLLDAAGVVETTILANPIAGEQRQLRPLAKHIWLRDYYAHLADQIDAEGFTAKMKHHQVQIIRQQRLVLGLDKNLNVVSDPALDTSATPDSPEDDLRFVPVYS